MRKLARHKLGREVSAFGKGSYGRGYAITQIVTGRSVPVSGTLCTELFG